MENLKSKLNARLLFVLSLLLSINFAMITSCEGPAGAVGPAGPAGPAGAEGPAGVDGNNSLIGFAMINSGDGPTGACIWSAEGTFLPCVYNIGGSATDSVTVEKIAVGDYRVFFHGNYGPKPVDPDVSLRYLFTVLANTSQGDGTYVAAASHASDGFASADGTDNIVRLESRIQIWNTTDLAPADKDFTVVMLNSQ